MASFEDSEDRQSEVISAAQEAEESPPLNLFEMNNETGMSYFFERYSKSFTDEDADFQECLINKLGDPPIMEQYRIHQKARRSFHNNNNHNNNYNNNHGRQRYNNYR